MFPSEDDWPFPVYLGGCGRFIVEEYVGPNLSSWLPSASWKERIGAALQLLKIAEKFTKGVSGLRMYITDLSLDNVAVTSTGDLKIVDGEHVIVVDLEIILKGKLCYTKI